MEVTPLKKKKSNQNQHTQMWVVGSGKGGVGKTFVSTSLAITLSKLGHQVVIVDMDLSGANVHTSLGVDPSHLSLRHYFDGQKQLSEIVLPTPHLKLSYIQGLWDTWSSYEVTADQIKAMIPEFKKLNAEYIIVDLGVGASPAYMEFFKEADEKILVTNPEPTTIEKTYRYIESYICSSLKEELSKEQYEQLIIQLREHRQGTLTEELSFKQLLRGRSFTKIPIRLVMNSSRSQTNKELGYSMKSVTKKYYDLGLDYIGAIDYDNAVWQSVKGCEHVLFAQPFTPLAGQFLSACKHLIDPGELRAVV